MICLSPLLVKIRPSDTNFRKKIIEFVEINPENLLSYDALPCGRCINCRLSYMHEWGIRCMHESLSSPANFFVTLTYNPENLPLNSSLCSEDLTLFFKRLRFHFSGSGKSDIRYFACGEYGSANKRPHYHVIFFNLRIPDLFFDRIIRGKRYFRSLTIENLWKKGFVLIGPVNYESAAYVAGYSLKKQKGRSRTFYYKDLSTHIISSFQTKNSTLSVLLADYKPQFHKLRKGKILADLSTAYDISTGECIFPDLLDSQGNPTYDPFKTKICILHDEFSVMSRRPGIGFVYFEKNKEEMFKNGFITFKNRRFSIPKYYLRKFYETCSDCEFTKAQDARQAFVDSLNIPDFDAGYLKRKLVSVEKRLQLFSNRYL